MRGPFDPITSGGRRAGGWMYEIRVAGAVRRRDGHVRIVEPVGPDVRQQRALAQVVLDELREIGIRQLVVGYAITDRVGDRDIAGPGSVHQPWGPQHRVRAEGQRIDKIVVDAAINYVYPAQAGRGEQ